MKEAWVQYVTQHLSGSSKKRNELFITVLTNATAPSQQIMTSKYIVTLVTLAVVYFDDFDSSLMFKHFPSATESKRR